MDKGYSLVDFQQICESIAGQSLGRFFQDFVYGKVPIEDGLSKALDFVGCELKLRHSKQLIKKHFGFRVSHKDNQFIVSDIATGSPANRKLCIGDKLVEVNGKNPTRHRLNAMIIRKNLVLQVDRRGRKLRVSLKPSERFYFDQFKIIRKPQPTATEKSRFQKWMAKTKTIGELELS